MFRGSAYSIQTDLNFDENQAIVQQTIKIALVGTSKVGKTSIIRALSNQQYQQNLSRTKGFQFRFKKLTFSRYVVKLYLWDGVGDKMQNYIQEDSFKDIDAIMYVFDFTDITSLHQLQQLHYQIQNKYKIFYPSILIANKCDLMGNQILSKQNQQNMKKYLNQVNFIAQKFAKRAHMMYLKVSAKQNNFITDSFVQLIKEALRERKRLRTSRSFGDQQIFETQTNIKPHQSLMDKICIGCGQCNIY